MIDELEKLLRESMTSEFTPYVEMNEEADALTAYFKGDADYSKRLTDHVTLYLSLDSNELVGCRIKGVSGILEDLPNFLTIDHDGVELSVLFLSYFGEANEQEREQLRELGRVSRDLRVPLPV